MLTVPRQRVREPELLHRLVDFLGDDLLGEAEALLVIHDHAPHHHVLGLGHWVADIHLCFGGLHQRHIQPSDGFPDLEEVVCLERLSCALQRGPEPRTRSRHFVQLDQQGPGFGECFDEVLTRVGREHCSHVHEHLFAFTVRTYRSELNTPREHFFISQKGGGAEGAAPFLDL